MEPRALPIVLYIDDTPDSRLLVSRILARTYLVLEAGDAISGIELALDTHPDLILLDINLPQLGGREAAVRLKSLLPQTPLVAFSADVSSEARQRALAAGFAGYLTKPIEDLDEFVEQIGEFLAGKQEPLPNAAHYQKQFTTEVVARLEEKVRELTKTADRNNFLNQQNQILIADLQRRQSLLEAAARISHIITSILDLDELMQVAVRVICEEYGFHFAAIFLVDADRQVASLRAGHGDCGDLLLTQSCQLSLNEVSSVSRAILSRQHQLHQVVPDALGVELPPLITDCRFELVLPLIVKDDVLGALSLHSNLADAYADEDMPAFRALVDQVAIAIANARLMRDLSHAHQELLRVKTFEAIATATGEAIHWVGNKAAPIPASACRVQEDVLSLVNGLQQLLDLPADERLDHPLWPAWQETLTTSNSLPPPPYTLQPFTLESIVEDLAIIEQSATTILNVKEDLIGPARLRNAQEIHLPNLLHQAIFEMGLPEGVVAMDFSPELPVIVGDERQLGQVFNNLIKNAWEAMLGQETPHIHVRVFPADGASAVHVQVSDNGPGIPPDILDKIWVSFFTTKGDRGGTGLGLSACMAIINQHEGKIAVESQLGRGTTFTVTLPLARQAGEI
jgi:signal transduction histidine kinase/DNA-binding NarL/FixJ family response regulator